MNERSQVFRVFFRKGRRGKRQYMFVCTASSAADAERRTRLACANAAIERVMTNREYAELVSASE